MIRNPMLDFFAGALFAMGGPMTLMLPQRIFLEMIASGGRMPEAARVRDDRAA